MADRVSSLTTTAPVVAGAAYGDLGEAKQRRLNSSHCVTAEFTVVPQAAHLLQYEQPIIVAKLIPKAAGHSGRPVKSVFASGCSSEA